MEKTSLSTLALASSFINFNVFGNKAAGSSPVKLLALHLICKELVNSRFLKSNPFFSQGKNFFFFFVIH